MESVSRFEYEWFYRQMNWDKLDTDVTCFFYDKLNNLHIVLILYGTSTCRGTKGGYYHNNLGSSIFPSFDLVNALFIRWERTAVDHRGNSRATRCHIKDAISCVF